MTTVNANHDLPELADVDELVRARPAEAVALVLLDFGPRTRVLSPGAARALAHELSQAARYATKRRALPSARR